jgi:hypothetical protein
MGTLLGFSDLEWLFQVRLFRVSNVLTELFFYCPIPMQCDYGIAPRSRTRRFLDVLSPQSEIGSARHRTGDASRPRR